VLYYLFEDIRIYNDKQLYFLYFCAALRIAATSFLTFLLKRYSEKPDQSFLIGNAQIVKMGTTGFDSKDSEFVSIPSYEITLVKPNFNFLNGEDNYALAA